MIFEFTQTNNKLRVLIIGETYRAYEQEDGSVTLNDERAGFSFYPTDSYEQFRKKFIMDWRDITSSTTSGRDNIALLKQTY